MRLAFPVLSVDPFPLQLVNDISRKRLSNPLNPNDALLPLQPVETKRLNSLFKEELLFPAMTLLSVGCRSQSTGCPWKTKDRVVASLLRIKSGCRFNEQLNSEGRYCFCRTIPTGVQRALLQLATQYRVVSGLLKRVAPCFKICSNWKHFVEAGERKEFSNFTAEPCESQL